MKYSSCTKALALATAVALTMTATPADAASKTEAGCINTIYKNAGKYAATLLKNSRGCHKDRAKGKQPVSADCNDLTPGGDADTKGKAAGARAKTIAGIAGKCANKDGSPITSITDTGGAGLYKVCIGSSAADGGDGIDNATELSTCIADFTEIAMTNYARRTFGAPDVALALVPDPGPRGIGKDLAKCQDKVVNSLVKIVASRYKERGKCLATAMKANTAEGVFPSYTDCDGASVIAKTTAAIGKLSATIDACPADISLIKVAADRNGWKTLINEADTRIAEGATWTTLEMESCNINHVDVFILAGTDATSAGIESNTELDIGWKGIGHNVDIPSGFQGQVTTTCNDNCDECTVNIDTDKTKDTSTCRCRADTTITCDVINGSDGDDCSGLGDDQCDCVFGPPLPLNASSTPVCVINRITEDIGQGPGDTANLATGDAVTTVTTRAVVHTGIAQTRPCPTCEAGVCNGGARDGLACDIDTTHGVFGDLSYDCFPEDTANISGSGVKLDLVLTTGTSSITNSLPCTAGGLCPCGTCSGDITIGCQSDTECSDAGAGVCDSSAGLAVEKNDCRTNGGAADPGGTCIDDGTGTGICDTSESTANFLTFCDAVVRPNGNGLISCSTSGDCDSTDCGAGVGPGLCGTCSEINVKSCFLDNPTRSGAPGQFGSQLASVFCNGQTGSGAVDGAAGAPSAGAAVLSADYEARCSSGDPTDPVFPAGQNCP